MILRQAPLPIALLFVAIGCGSGPGSDADPYAVRVLETPTSAASLAPNLATGPDGTVILSWIERGDIFDYLKYSVFDGTGWGQSRAVTNGDNWFVNWADFPSVVPISETLWAAHWLVRRAAGGYAYDIYAAFSDDAGQTWSEPFNPHTDDTDTEHGFVTMFPSGDGIGMVWLDGRKFVNEYDANDVAASGMTLRAANFSPDRTPREEVLVDDLICDCCQTDVALTSQGPVAVYRDRTPGEIRDIYLVRYVDGEWQAGKPVANDGWNIPGCPVNGPVIQSNGSQLAVAWFSAGNNAPKVQLAWSNDSGNTMSAPVRVADGGLLGHVGASMLPSGDMVVSWLGGAKGGKAELHLRHVSQSGEAGPDKVIAEATGIAPFSVPQLLLTGDELLLAWTDTSGDESAVKTALVPLQYLGVHKNGD